MKKKTKIAGVNGKIPKCGRLSRPSLSGQLSGAL